jgi:hypothetical protein
VNCKKDYWCNECEKAAMIRHGDDDESALKLLLKQLEAEREKFVNLKVENTRLECKNASLEDKIVEMQQKINKMENCVKCNHVNIDGGTGESGGTGETGVTVNNGGNGGKKEDKHIFEKYTYSKAAASNKQTLIIKPEDGKFEHVKNMKTQILKDNKDVKIIKLVENTEKKQLEIQCASSEEREQLKSNLQNNKNLMRNVNEVSEKSQPNKELRKLKLYNLEKGEHEDDDQFLDTVIRKNDLDSNKPDFQLRVSYLGPRKKSNDRQDMIMEMDDATYSQLMKWTTMYTPWGRHRIEEYVRVKVCKKCQCYGHTERLCTARTVCSYCGGNHTYEECRAVEKKCANCEKYNRRNPDNVVDMYHAAYEKCCPTYVHVRKQIVKQMQQ